MYAPTCGAVPLGCTGAGDAAGTGVPGGSGVPGATGVGTGAAPGGMGAPGGAIIIMGWAPGTGIEYTLINTRVHDLTSDILFQIIIY